MAAMTEVPRQICGLEIWLSRLLFPLLLRLLNLPAIRVAEGLSLSKPPASKISSVTTLVVDRRSALKSARTAAVALVGVGWAASPPVVLAEASLDEPGMKGTVPPGKAVLVLGANGQTGRRVVQTLAAAATATDVRGTMRRPCIATTRSGKLDYEVVGNVQTATIDVSDLESVRRATSTFSDLGAVIFCASVSSNQDSFAVDRDGVINAARCCIEQQIPRLVVVSSGAVSRPDSPVYLLLNTVAGGIMEAKIEGEDAVRDIYRDPRLVESGIGYTVIRPGGLNNDDPVGPGGLELNQGDTKSGRLSRQDVASLCVACLDSASAFDATFECYNKETAKPLESVGLSNILKLRNPTEFKSGRECQGSSFDELFRGLERDV
jgi:uncharacterized protein YbjT (DUF2867 family)